MAGAPSVILSDKFNAALKSVIASSSKVLMPWVRSETVKMLYRRIVTHGLITPQTMQPEPSGGIRANVRFVRLDNR